MIFLDNIYRVSSVKTLKIGIVPGLWENPKIRGTIPGFWVSEIQKFQPDGVGTLGLWDSPNVPELFQTFRSLRLKNKPYCVRTLGLWDSPKVPVLSQVIGRLRLKYNPHGV